MTGQASLFDSPPRDVSRETIVPVTPRTARVDGEALNAGMAQLPRVPSDGPCPHCGAVVDRALPFLCVWAGPSHRDAADLHLACHPIWWRARVAAALEVADAAV